MTTCSTTRSLALPHTQRNNPLRIAGTVTATAAAQEPARFGVYPNPATGPVTVQASRAGSLQVFNGLGQLVHAQAVQAGATTVALAAKGLLLFVLTTGTERQVVRQVMQ